MKKKRNKEEKEEQGFLVEGIPVASLYASVEALYKKGIEFVDLDVLFTATHADVNFLYSEEDVPTLPSISDLENMG